MNDVRYPQPARRRAMLFFSGLMAALLFLTVFQTMMAQGERFLPPDLEGSAKSVDNEEAFPGSTIEYTIVLSNSGDLPATGVLMTDTLPTGLTYGGNLTVDGGGSAGEASGVVTWTGAVNNNASVTISFEAMLDENGLVDGQELVNTAIISGSGFLLTRSITTTVFTATNTIAYLPMISRVAPAVTLSAIGRPTPANSWTLNWAVNDGTLVTNYEVQEANNSAFAGATTLDAGAATSLVINRPAKPDNFYFYRVRAVGSFGNGAWSNVQNVIGGFRDDFDNPATGWDIRRQDTDDITNAVYYQNGHLILEMDSRWDYQLVSSLAKAPAPPYIIETSVRMVGVDNLQSYGIIFGGDWNGQTCPDDDYSSCFNHYYRLNIIWYGAPSKMRIQLKRIDFHDEDDNSGRGEDLVPFSDVPVNEPPEGYQVWAVEVHADGTIRILVNGNVVATAVDTTYINEPYFGAFSSTDEYTGLQAEYDWYKVSILP